MEWAVRCFLKVMAVVLVIWVAISFVRQLFSPVERPVVMATSSGSQLPDPLPPGGMPAKPEPTATVPQLVPPPPPPPLNAPASEESSAAALPALPPLDTTKAITEATHDQIRFRFLDATTQGNRLTLRLEALNQGLDRMIEIGSFPWSKTLFYNERGEVYLPKDVKVANVGSVSGQTRAMLVAGVPTEIQLLYTELPMVRGTLSFQRVTLMQLDVALYSTDQAYRNSFGGPIAVSRPTFRSVAIAEGSVSGGGPR